MNHKEKVIKKVIKKYPSVDPEWIKTLNLRDLEALDDIKKGD